MNKFFAIFLCSICCMVQANHLSDLEDAIIKSDIEGVKTILAIISLTERNKVGLIDLANDIILLRLKAAEIFSYKWYSQREIDLIKGSLSASTINEIEQLEKKADRVDTYGKIFSIEFCLSILGVFGVPIILLEEPRWFDILAAIGLTILPLVLFIVAHDMFEQRYETRTSIMKKIRDNLQKYHTDAILIKQLIIDTEVSVLTVIQN